MNLKHNLTLFCVLLLAVQTANAEWLDFTGWDESLITGGGQTFNNVCGDTNVTVTGTTSSFATSFSGDDIFIGGNTDSLSFTFTFDAPVNAMMDIHTLDSDEVLTITGGNPATYNHVFGNMPNQSGSLVLSGTAYGISPTGASHGEIDLGTVSSFTVSYEALKDNKFDRFSVGCSEVVPEPGTLMLILLGGMAMVCGRRS
ncbi:MAG: PEP-CTERM sorting domain-containing protein [Pseudomonadota bacterium]